jgi:hypothetical protein
VAGRPGAAPAVRVEPLTLRADRINGAGVRGLGKARFIDGENADARLGIVAGVAGCGLHHGCGRLCHDQRYLVVDAIAAEPVVAAELQRQPGLAGRLAIAGWCTVAGFRVALG